MTKCKLAARVVKIGGQERHRAIKKVQNKATTIRWRILFILIFVSFISYVLRSNISIAAPAMIENLALTEVQWGWVLAAFTTGYALFQIPGGIMGDRFGPRKALTLIARLWAVLTAPMTRSDGPISSGHPRPGPLLFVT